MFAIASKGEKCPERRQKPNETIAHAHAHASITPIRVPESRRLSAIYVQIRNVVNSNGQTGILYALDGTSSHIIRS